MLCTKYCPYWWTWLISSVSYLATNTILTILTILRYIHTYIQLVTVSCSDRSALSLSLSYALLSRLIHFNSSFFSFLFLLPHLPGERREKPHSSFSLPFLFFFFFFFPFIFLFLFSLPSPLHLPANSLSGDLRLVYRQFGDSGRLY